MAEAPANLLAVSSEPQVFGKNAAAGAGPPPASSPWAQKRFVHPPLKCLEPYLRIDEYPMVAWCFHSMHPKGRFVVGDQFADDAKALGFNVLIDVDGMLAPCRKTGLKLLAVAYGPKPEELQRRYFAGPQAEDPCLMGMIMDDDCKHIKPEVRKAAAWLKAHHPDIIPLISKYPTHAPQSDSDIRVLMTQIYPFSHGAGRGALAVRDYCNECNAERKFCNAHDMCLWPIFAGGNNFNRIRFQMMAALAYGAQGLVNFAYTPTRETTPQYHPGNPQVAHFKQMHDYISQVVGRHLWGTRCLKVIHSPSGGEHDGAPHPEAGTLVANMSDSHLVGLLATEDAFSSLEKQTFPDQAADTAPEYLLWVDKRTGSATPPSQDCFLMLRPEAVPAVEVLGPQAGSPVRKIVPAYKIRARLEGGDGLLLRVPPDLEKLLGGKPGAKLYGEINRGLAAVQWRIDAPPKAPVKDVDSKAIEAQVVAATAKLADLNRILQAAVRPGGNISQAQADDTVKNLQAAMEATLAEAGRAPRQTGSQAESPATMLTVRADYNTSAGPLDKARLLNGSVGGYDAMNNLNWLPESYDNLAAVGLKMIRLDHLVNDKFYRVVSRDAAGKLRFDFSGLDRVVLPMLPKGMVPLMCLSYCPDVLIPKGGNEGSPPKNMGEWKQIATAFARHYKDLGHSGWYWEVWNEPDDKWFFKGSARQYLELYVSTAEGIKDADPGAKVGGAADASVLSATNKLAPLLDYIKLHPSVPLDYISYHKYGGSTLDEKPPYDLEWWLDEVSSQLKSRGLPPRDIFVTEWNLTPVMNPGPGADSDTNRMAAGIAARMYNALQHPALTKVFYFSPIEGYRPARIFNGDLGLLTVNNHKKAVYNVFEMFACLGETLLQTKIGGMVAKNHATYALATKNAASGQAVVLLWNYGDHAVSFDLTVNHLPYGPGGKNILAIQYRVDAGHANYYKDYRAGLRGYKTGPSEDLSPADCCVAASASSFRRVIALSPFSVAELILVPTRWDVVPLAIADDADPKHPRGKKPPANRAAARPVTASSSLEKAGWAKNCLVDEITHSLPGALGWSSSGCHSPNHDEWACVDLGQAVPIDTVKLYPRDDQEAEGGGFPLDFKIQAADDQNHWTDLLTQTGYRNGQPVLGVQTFAFSSHRCRYVRVYATRLGKVSSIPLEYRFQLAELEVYGRND